MTKTIERTALPPLPEIDDATRREFLIGAAGLLLLPAGCRNGGESGNRAASGETRTVEHALGTTKVPARPTRVAAPYVVGAVNLALLSIAQLAGPEETAGWLSPVKGFLPEGVNPEGVEIIGTSDELNLEALAVFEPQMILAYDDIEEMYEELSQIAPTVLNEYGKTGDWRPRFDRDAAAVGRTEEAKAVEADYEEALDSLSGFTEMFVSFIRVDSGGTFRIDDTGSFPGSVMSDAGVSVAEAPEGVGEDSGAGFVENVSGERLDVVTGDVIVVPDWTAAAGEDRPDLAAFERNPLWKTLPAVRTGRVVEVSGAVYNGGNYAAARRLIEAIADAVG